MVGGRRLDGRRGRKVAAARKAAGFVRTATGYEARS
jgi:hypothetical protein